MHSYEINIHCEPVDMSGIYEALRKNGVDFDPAQRRGSLFDLASDEEQPTYVFVELMQVVRAVGVINELGYHTDEEEDTE